MRERNQKLEALKQRVQERLEERRAYREAHCRTPIYSDESLRILADGQIWLDGDMEEESVNFNEITCFHVAIERCPLCGEIPDDAFLVRDRNKSGDNVRTYRTRIECACGRMSVLSTEEVIATNVVRFHEIFNLIGSCIALWNEKVESFGSLDSAGL